MEPVKPGYKSSEFYLSALAMIVSMLYASGLISDGSTIEKIMSFISMALVAMGYSVSRALVKK